MNIVQCTNSKEVVAKGRSVLYSWFEQYQDVPILFMASGGSALTLLQGERGLLPQQFTVTVLDERYGVEQSQQNTFAVLNTGLWKQAHVQGAKYIPWNEYTKPLTQAGLEIEQHLRQWKKSNPSGKIIVTQGVGADAHTAGILPMSDDERFVELFTSDRWVVGYDTNGIGEFAQRLTVSCTFLTTMVDHAIVFMTGQSKQKALQAIVENTTDTIVTTPALVVSKMNDVVLVTDSTT